MSAPSTGGASGLLSRVALGSKLTPLVIIVSLALGIFALATMPREDDPSISVPAVQVVIAWPGHTAAESDERVARVVGSWLRQIATVEHVSSAASDDGAAVSLQFLAGNREEDAITQVRARLDAHAAELPMGARIDRVALVGSDDVPALTVTFWNDRGSPTELRRVVQEIGNQLQSFPDVSDIALIGGSRRTFQVYIDPARLAAHGRTAREVLQAIQSADAELPVGAMDGPGGHVAVRAGVHLRTAAEFSAVVVGTSATEVVRLDDVAEVTDGTDEPAGYVSFAGRETGGAQHTAVTLALQKVRGSNATALNERVRSWLEQEGRAFLTSDVHFAVVRDAGETASEKVKTLLEHMLIAVSVVVAIVAFALGGRAAVVVAVVIPVTLAFVPFVYKLTGFTLNRITLAAMIFAIGILVDDAIVILENVHRHYDEQRRNAAVDWRAITVRAVEEVGNPTILATLIVIAALMPMAATGGMVGQFMRALPIGASVAMAYSLLVALTLTPFLAHRILRPKAGHASEAEVQRQPAWLRVYGRALGFLAARRSRSIALFGGALALLGGAFALLATRVVTFKNMPASNVDRCALIVTLPPASTLADTNRVATELAARLLETPEVLAIQTYVGVGGPVDFQGLARGYGARTGTNQAELQLELRPVAQRHRSSHDIATELRRNAHALLASPGTTFTIAEEPLGPPVQAALVAEVYAPTEQERLAAADQVAGFFRTSPGVVDVDSTATRGPLVATLSSDANRLAGNALDATGLAHDMGILVRGVTALEVSLPGEAETTHVRLHVARHDRISAQGLTALSIANREGRPVPVMDFASVERRLGSRVLLRKDLVPVIYVTGEMEGNASSLYSMIDLSKSFAKAGGALARADVRWDEARPEGKVVRWGGEWTPSFEMNRDLGVAFGAVLVIIYLLLVGWYGSYATPLVVMLPIPLALVGIVPAHLIAGIPMSGMGTIGIIALAGLMVRNSILIVDFARHHIERGMPLVDAVVLAGEERARPILLTAATVVLGDGVLFFDPLLQGLGLTMASGALVSTILTLVIVPVAYASLLSLRTRLAGDERSLAPHHRGRRDGDHRAAPRLGEHIA